MKHHLNRSLIYLALTDLIWYLSIAFLFFSSFYKPIVDVVMQAQDAITKNTQAIAQTQDLATSQISLEPHVQLLITYLLFFTALAAILGIVAELIKTKIIYKKPFWLKTIGLQIGQLASFIIMVNITVYLLYIQLLVPVIPMWLMVTLITAVWALFFWAIAHSKAKVYAKRKFNTSTLWLSYALTGACVLLTSFQIYELAILSGFLWLVGWNWLQLHIASFK